MSLQGIVVKDNYDVVATAGNVSITVLSGGNDIIFNQIVENTARMLNALLKSNPQAKILFCRGMGEVCSTLGAQKEHEP